MIDPKHVAKLTDETVFPLFLFSPEYPEGKLIGSKEHWPTEGEWADTPQKFEEGYKEPAAVVTGDLPRDAALAGFVVERYPAHLYRKGDADNPLVINSAEHEADLEESGKYNPAEWRESPDPKHKCWKDGPTAHVGAPSDPPPTPPAEELTPDQVAQQKQDLWNTNVGEAQKLIAGVPSLTTLARIKAYESENPKGARAGVLKAIAAREAALNAKP